jgi:hypothetical protein
MVIDSINALQPTPSAPLINIPPGAGSAQYAAGSPPPDNNHQSLKNEYLTISGTGLGERMIIEGGNTGDWYLAQS